MKILTDREYELRIREAEERGAEKARHDCFVDRENERFHDGVFREMGEMRQGFRRLVDQLDSKINMVAGECGIDFEKDKKTGTADCCPL